ncbi:MAG TPA: ATP-binding protein [Bacteroidota bacterium]|nr:ATP-binding protein [Bacteroidota bacterium]
MSNFPQKISKTIPSRTDNLLEVREFVSEAARQFGFGDEDVANIVLAVDEACTNIIKHAYQYAPDKEIFVSIIRNDGTFEVKIRDHGKNFDPTELRPPDLKQNLSHHRRGGLGVYLMKKLMDKVEYHFTEGKNNEVSLVKYLAKQKSAVRK